MITNKTNRTLVTYCKYNILMPQERNIVTNTIGMCTFGMCNKTSQAFL